MTLLSTVKTKQNDSSGLKRLGMGIMYLILVGVAVFQLYPLLWLFFFSLKGNREIFGQSPFALPEDWLWENYQRVWTVGNMDTYFFNSVFITVTAVVLTLLFASLATFAIMRMKWKFSGIALLFIMVGYMIPIHTALVPLFSMFLRVGLLDNHLSIILVYIAYHLPLTVMILSGFYSQLSREIEEAAIVDGASIHRIFFQITLPMTTPVLSTTMIINMIYNWNEFVFANTFLSSDSLRTLTVGIQSFVGQYLTDWGAIGATLVISIVPVLVAYLFLSNRIVEGVAAGSVKG
ncbi:carbohydrate ABC transporter membrane protein 2, CUT1 family [Pelagirhabdus alkalitolerans]|uniref:Carbohydrate ABC transporter membrane protein 2, CUT1 family n=1 Tax=Pelagirhabdus alkalitolerans TaxID=1612202 RepID=A0A1G6L3G1_9BACI|nr:carbohydrate ABC transporter permease [Pelagirhabdus alkalitolerans]SDC37852.1 carbohydrate ABC transporter membrane protein 2, CUT1 family [Pelagirhabdus alkalitolerans]